MGAVRGLPTRSTRTRVHRTGSPCLPFLPLCSVVLDRAASPCAAGPPRTLRTPVPGSSRGAAGEQSSRGSGGRSAVARGARARVQVGGEAGEHAWAWDCASAGVRVRPRGGLPLCAKVAPPRRGASLCPGSEGAQGRWRVWRRRRDCVPLSLCGAPAGKACDPVRRERWAGEGGDRHVSQLRGLGRPFSLPMGPSTLSWGSVSSAATTTHPRCPPHWDPARPAARASCTQSVPGRSPRLSAAGDLGARPAPWRDTRDRQRLERGPLGGRAGPRGTTDRPPGEGAASL